MSARSRLIRLCSATVVSAFIAGAAMLTAPAAFADSGAAAALPLPATAETAGIFPTASAGEQSTAAPAEAPGTEPEHSAQSGLPQQGDHQQSVPNVQQPEDVSESSGSETAEQSPLSGHQDQADDAASARESADPEPQRTALQGTEPQNTESHQLDEQAPIATLETKVSIAQKQSLTVTATAAGLPSDIVGAHAALVEAGTAESLADPAIDAPAYADPNPAVVDGATVIELTAPASALDRSKTYAFVVWQEHTPITAESVYVQQPVVVSEAQWDQLFGATKPETKPVTDIGSFSWAVLDRFIAYVEGPIAGGKVEVQSPAKRSGKNFDFTQVAGGSWKGASGSLPYGGDIRFTGHAGALDLTISNPVVAVAPGAQSATLSFSYNSVDMATGKRMTGTAVVATLDLTRATRTVTKGHAVRFDHAPATLTKDGVGVFQDFYEAGQELAPVTFVAGIASKAEPVVPPKTNPGTVTKPKPKPAPKPITPTPPSSEGAQSAGSLSWGVSTAFADYVTGPIAKGEVTTSGVGSSGGAYLFPQVSGGDWNAKTQTGSVQYSGVVTYTGHHGLLREGVSNPMIQVTGPTTAVLYSGGAQWATLDLGSASKSVGANGEVTWSGVPVNGGFSGGASGSSGYTLPADGLSFTVGAAGGASYGSTSVSNASKKRTVAETAPTTTGIRILTAPDQITAGGELEFEAEGFEAGEREMIVALYPGITVLDEAAGANDAGTVRWLGTLPEDIEPGEYTITVQGSADAGAVFTVVDEKDAKAAKKKAAEAKSQITDGVNGEAVAAAGVVSIATGPAWLWWVGAGALALIAAAMGGLVAVQRRAGTQS